MKVPFNRPSPLGREIEYAADAFARAHISGDGVYSARATKLLEQVLGSRVLLTTSCTHALEMAALLLDVVPGDEVIVPAFTFPSTVNAFVLRGATPIFADIRPDTLNIDESEIESLIRERTRAIVPVHYAGIACDLDRLTAIARAHGLALVEDNAHGLFGGYKERPLGTFGNLSTLSFHETKNVTCGEGGALVVNDPALVERAEIIREKGTNRSRFFRGEVDKYGWIDLGSSYVLSDLLAAVLLAQLEQREAVQARRRAIWSAYMDALSPWAAECGARLPPAVNADVAPAYHLFYVVMPSAESRDAAIAWLRERGVYAVFHYQPLNRSIMAQQLTGAARPCPISEGISDRLLRLPLFNSLTDAEQQHVIESMLAFRAAGAAG